MTETQNTQNDKTIKKLKINDRINLILAIIVSLLCCLSTPLSAIGYIGNILSIVTVAFCSIFAVRFSARKIPTVILLVTLFTAFGLTNGLPVIALILSCTVGCGALAWLISKTGSPFLAIIPAVAYAASTLLIKDWFASLLTLLFIFPAILLAQSYDKMTNRVGALLRVSLGYIAFIVVGIFFTVLYFTGEFRIEVITDVLESLKLSLIKVMSSIEMDMLNGETQTLLSETDAYNYVSLLFSLLPSLTVIFCFIMSYFAQKVLFSVFEHIEGEDGSNELRRTFVMSPIAAIIFVLSFIIYLITSAYDSTATVATVTANLYLIFLPGLAYM